MKFELKAEDRVKDAHLKSCPFCGQNAYAYDGTIYPIVKCSSCNAVLYAYVDETVKEMCQRWNRRLSC